MESGGMEAKHDEYVSLVTALKKTASKDEVLNSIEIITRRSRVYPESVSFIRAEWNQFLRMDIKEHLYFILNYLKKFEKQNKTTILKREDRVVVKGKDITLLVHGMKRLVEQSKKSEGLRALVSTYTRLILELKKIMRADSVMKNVELLKFYIPSANDSRFSSLSAEIRANITSQIHFILNHLEILQREGNGL